MTFRADKISYKSVKNEKKKYPQYNDNLIDVSAVIGFSYQKPII